MPPTYRIHAWETTFETAQSRRVDRLRWMPIPLDHDDSDGYTEMMGAKGVSLKTGPAYYGCWAGTFKVAARCHPRGVLVRRDGRPHTPESVSRITRMHLGTMRDAWKCFIGMGWLEPYSASGTPPGPSGSESAPSALGDPSTEVCLDKSRVDQSRREDRTEEDPSSDPPSTNPSSLDPPSPPTGGKRAPTEEDQEGPRKGPGCAACVDGLRVDLRPPECCSCSRGRQRARSYRKGAEADRAQDRRNSRRATGQPKGGEAKKVGAGLQDHLEKLAGPGNDKEE